MAKALLIDPDKCVGCMLCVMACAMEHGEAIGPVNSRILPIRLKKQEISIPVVCRQCGKPLCADVCPMGALSRQKETGAMVVDIDLCIACGMCNLACPLGGISMDVDAGHAVKCDLCGGDPLCVKFCAYGALNYITQEEATMEARKEAVRKLADMLEKIA
jgi:carbon-monoxide dehydrogenase iron sulfur subunit